jgi:hypothetical protein
MAQVTAPVLDSTGFFATSGASSHPTTITSAVSRTPSARIIPNNNVVSRG